MRNPLPPDAYAATAVAAAIALEWFIPLPLLPPLAWLSPTTFIGLALVLMGFALELSAARALTAARTTTRPNAEPTALVTTGPFAHSRNPFYLGILLLLTGLSLAFSLDWSVLTLPLFAIALDRLIIPTEEQRLATAFGTDWQAYAQATPRWLRPADSK